jgi:hypothetical protein
MATYTVEAFRWSGTGYNALYNTSYTAVLDDNDGSFQGGSDASETVAINGGAAGSTNSLPYAINVSFTDTLGNPHVETFFFSTPVQRRLGGILCLRLDRPSRLARPLAAIKVTQRVGLIPRLCALQKGR